MATKAASDRPGTRAINTGYSWRWIPSDSSFLAVEWVQHMAAQETARNPPKETLPQQRRFPRGKQTGIQDGVVAQNVRILQHIVNFILV